MKIPSELVRGKLLQIFARAAAEFSVAPRDLVVFLCLAMANPGERIAVKAVELITGLIREEVLASLGALKTGGFIDQLGDVFPITSRGKALLAHAEKD